MPASILAFLSFLAGIGGATAGTPIAGKPIAGIAGSWEFSTNETSGALITGGYFRREYLLNANGTYEYLTKSFSAYNPVILFGRETGTWTVKDNQLTIRPTQGKNEEWSKIDPYAEQSGQVSVYRMFACALIR